jgi:hypothetical protein
MPTEPEIRRARKRKTPVGALRGQESGPIGHLVNVTPDVIASNAVGSRLRSASAAGFGRPGAAKRARHFSWRSPSSPPGVAIKHYLYKRTCHVTVLPAVADFAQAVCEKSPPRHPHFGCIAVTLGCHSLWPPNCGTLCKAPPSGAALTGHPSGSERSTNARDRKWTCHE